VGRRPSVVIAGMVAGQPHQGGAAWAVLQYVLGCRSLGYDVTLVQPVASATPDAVGYFRRVVEAFGLDGQAALVDPAGATAGMTRESLLARMDRADVLFNISGMLRDEEMLAAIPRRVLLDLDPAFNQIWHLQGADMGFDRHTHFVTIATQIGQPSCTVPECDVPWITTLQPIVLDAWPVSNTLTHDALTTVGHWRSYGSVVHDGVFYGQKAHAWRGLMGIPSVVAKPCMPALAIHADEIRDLAALDAAGWQRFDPSQVCDTPATYQAFVAGSWAELGIAKSGYVVSGSGWFSDRSIAYLASGRPVIAHDTGFSAVLPIGEGLMAFSTPTDVAEAVDAIASDYSKHRRRAREIAEEFFDARRVLPLLVDRVLG